MNKIALVNELERRNALWASIQQFPLDKVRPSHLNENFIYRGSAGIYSNKELTSVLSADGIGVTLSILHSGKHYPDEVTSDGLLYHYPKTNRSKSHDQNEIIATKNAGRLELPIFVILPGNTASFREVRLGWVVDFDDKAEVFLISYSEVKPQFETEEEDEPFRLTQKDNGKATEGRSRPNQLKFMFNVHKKYGSKCAVCNITINKLLDAAHIRGKKYNGSDDWRNGIVLCKNHHKSFDSGLFKIDPNSLNVIISEKINNKELKISGKRLNTATGKAPHINALKWKWKNQVFY